MYGLHRCRIKMRWIEVLLNQGWYCSYKSKNIVMGTFGISHAGRWRRGEISLSPPYFIDASLRPSAASAHALFYVCAPCNIQQPAKSIADKRLQAQIPESKHGFSRTLSCSSKSLRWHSSFTSTYGRAAADSLTSAAVLHNAYFPRC
jgi:hypothetical protein